MLQALCTQVHAVAAFHCLQSCLTFCKRRPYILSLSNRDPDMELREEAWSPGPLDSEDQQMASHENPGEATQVVL
jgi:hypothetical protein